MQINNHSKRPQRILGIDYGLARIGLALSDENKIIAIPFMTFQASKRTEDTVTNLLAALIKFQEENKYEILEIVIGLPLMMSGKSGFLADEVNHFVTLFRQATTLPITAWDERLTTVQAERSLRESNMSRKKRSKVVDKVSAAIILQSYLDRRNFQIERIRMDLEF